MTAGFGQSLKKPMTRVGYERLAVEYNELLHEIRPKVVQGVADAAAEGDRSENAEYIYGKKRLREIDKRLAYLTRLLDGVQIIDPQTIKAPMVDFGATVTLETASGKRVTFTLVGEGESDADRGRISWKSPLGQALRGKKAGDEVVVERPEDDLEYLVIEFAYLALE